MINAIKNMLKPTPELMGQVIKLMPEPIPSLVAENGRLARLMKPTERLLEKGKPDAIGEDYWQLLTEQHAAMIEYKADVNVRLDAAIEAHKQDLDNGLPLLKKPKK